MQLIQNGSISVTDVTTFLSNTNYMEIENYANEASYKTRIDNAEKSYNTINVNPIK